jgi:hypothetical protein
MSKCISLPSTQDILAYGSVYGRKKMETACAGSLTGALWAGHAASSPGFDNGSVNEIFWYGTFGMIEPRAPWVS